MANCKAEGYQERTEPCDMMTEKLIVGIESLIVGDEPEMDG